MNFIYFANLNKTGQDVFLLMLIGQDQVRILATSMKLHLCILGTLIQEPGLINI